MKQDVDAQLWDTAGQEEFERIRVLGYENTTCFIVCFCVADFVTFENVKRLWLPELRRHNPDAKILLVGTKSDLRKPKETKRRGSERTGKTTRNKQVNNYHLGVDTNTIDINEANIMRFIFVTSK